MSKLTWKLQSKFVDEVQKGNVLFWDYASATEEYAFGDGYHFFVVPEGSVFIDFMKLGTMWSRLTRMKILEGFHNMDFSANVSLTFEQRVKDKGTLRKFEYLDKELFINEAYLKEFNFLKNPEEFAIGCDPDDGYKKPVMFECDYFTAVILPVRVGGQNG